MTTIKLKEVTRQNWREALSLSVAPDQQHFVADYAPPAAVALAKAYVRPGEMMWVPFAIYADDKMVGFTELAFEPDSSDQYWIYHFFIDQRYQGQGLGTEALRATVDMIKNSYCTCQAIQVTVHPDNAQAQHLYMALGFTPTGKMADGEPVYRYKV